MKTLDGSVGDILKEFQFLDFESVRRIVIQILEIFKAMHDVNIVHADFKPDNLMYTEDNEGNTKIFLVDFGLSQNYKEIHVVEFPIGTPNY